MLSRYTLVLGLVLSLLWDFFRFSFVNIVALGFGALSVYLLVSLEYEAAAQALFGAAVLWGMSEIRNLVSQILRVKEFEIDKPVQSVALLSRKREPVWRDELTELKREAGIPDWWGM